MSKSVWEEDSRQQASGPLARTREDDAWALDQMRRIIDQDSVVVFDYGERVSGSYPRVVVVQGVSSGSSVDYDMEEIGRRIASVLRRLDAVVAIALIPIEDDVIEVATWSRTQDLDELDTIVDYQVDAAERVSEASLHFSVYGPGEFRWQDAPRAGYSVVYLAD